MNILKNNSTFFNELNRKAINENIARTTRKPSVANTYKNEPEIQQTENISRNYKRIGDQVFADPFQFHTRPYDNYYDGRKLHMLNTLIYNAKRDKPDVITKHSLKVVNFY